jgi:ATP-dependent exoDNAse (exonuclease V) beta subunit
MIEQNTNVYIKQVTRILEINEKLKQVNFLDTRFYKRNEEYYPSITSILQYFPKGKFFETWLKDVGHNADYIVQKAAKEGTLTHEAIEQYLEGKEVTWLDDYGNAKYSLDVWRMILKFVEFWEREKPTLIYSEIHLFSDTYKIAGTCDLVILLRNKIWLLDIKTSNSLHTSQELQLAAYVTCWNETFEEKIENAGIIWLKSAKRGPDKSNKNIQGKGWEIKESSRSLEENWGLFDKIHDLYKLENPNDKPMLDSFPLSVHLKS